MANETEGVWRTVGGRRIFIKGGQDLASAMKESGKFKLSKKKENKYQKLTGAEEDGLAGLYGKKFDTPEDLASAVQMERNNRIGDFEAELDRMEEEGQNVSMYKEKGWDDEVNYNELVEKIKNNPSQFERYLNQKGSLKVDKNDIETLKKIADSNEDINKYEGLDDIAKDYIKNRRNEIGQKEFTEKANEIHNKTLEKAKESEKTTDENKRYNELRDKNYQDYMSGKKDWDQYEKGMSDAKKEASVDYDALWDKMSASDKRKINELNDDYAHMQGATEARARVREEQQKIYDKYIKKESSKEFDREKFNKWSNENSDKNIREYEKETGKDALHPNGDPTKDFLDYEKERYNTNSENLDLSKANDRFLAKSYALYDRDNGKISDEEYQKKLKEIDSHAGEKSISKESSKQGEVDIKTAEIMLRGTQRALEFEKDGLARAKRDGQSVENISDRTRRVHELELQVQKDEEYLNRVKAKNSSNDWIRNAFNQYKKDHPNTKMTLQDFMKNNKK